ncbi:hypothetical protein RBH29_17545 [Herbivorax sp. ANBcel31]|uniref:hypothetical protein n=1 Tax=Herbivorax sp. ANBcel31 TaxID=3069754 RepID=UPI0027B81AF6|nr:hypothetical protein [Herbivorax sp. ANBcel31]MDQ2088231.1 hypothetical protein [Herbivorax sp. ANBcel31]
MLPKYYVDYGKSIFLFDNLKRKIRIVGIDKLDYNELIREVQSGEKFVVFQYNIFLLLGFVRGVSPIYFTKEKFKENFARVRYNLLTSLTLIPPLTSLFLIIYLIKIGGLSWGIILIFAVIGIWTMVPLPTIIKNFKGGTDVTQDVLQFINNQANNDR